MVENDSSPDTTPLIKGFVLTYSVSGEPLEAIEVLQMVVRLPFCLYIPGRQYLLPHPETAETVGFVPAKVWTDKANGSTLPKSDLVAVGQSTYLPDSELTTDKIGQTEQFVSGVTARNMEFDKDPTGYFRFTRLTIEFDWEVPTGFDPYSKGDEETSQILAPLASKTLAVVNHIIDLYRIVTGDIYVDRIPTLEVEDIRIGIPKNWSIRQPEKPAGGKFDYKCGYHPNPMGPHGVRAAMVSKPKEIVDSFQLLLADGYNPPTYELLRQNAQAALDRLDVKLSIVEGFLSIEVFVEQFYRSRLKDILSESEIDNELTTGSNWRLPVRLKEMLKDRFGRSISDINNTLWAKWLAGYRMRNDLVHKNIIPDLAQTGDALNLNDEVVHILEGPEFETLNVRE